MRTTPRSSDRSPQISGSLSYFSFIQFFFQGRKINTRGVLCPPDNCAVCVCVRL